MRTIYEWIPSKSSLIFRTLTGWGAYEFELFGLIDIVNSKELYLGKIKGIKYWDYKSRFSNFFRMYLGALINLLFILPFMIYIWNYRNLCNLDHILCIKEEIVNFAWPFILFLYCLNLIFVWRLSFIGANKNFKYVLDEREISIYNYNKDFIDKIKYSQISGVYEELPPNTAFGKLIRILNLGMVDRSITIDYNENRKQHSFRLFGVPEKLHSKILNYLRRR